ncbi:MarR family winged helix-turn-helix transcriptional regulator [Mucilaginibacter sp. OK098]|uniref:MarR family winged helix-turn-helix transcriptional regulator n=1 Tax=Mucilaginibacter sp. OK098 TaxID=1855297 RepID=UPI00091DD2C2|nr:MarR family winged helix-turn-helix transcriptional regulator [Mucilaginibacter sp. OK098]SHL93689.1 DNA-binding transcriptional regulator, MarR family [Mucilaginibacter sp. OK098]
MKIEDEIKQNQFHIPQHKAGMNIIFTANWLLNEIAVSLKPIGLSLQQLNVLTILKGQPDFTATVNLIRERLIDRMPNVSRLLNKLMDKGLIKKDRDLSDQRVVYIKLTAEGETLAIKGRELFNKVSYGIDNEQAHLLNDLLDKVRK